MRSFNYTNIVKTKIFWRARKKLRDLVFRTKRQLYILQDHANTEVRKGRILKGFIKSVSWSCIKVFLIVTLLYLTEYLLGRFWHQYHLSFPSWIQNLVNVIPRPTYPDNKEQIIELISVIASISGVVLALFYPVLATIASTAYAKVQSNIRNLIFSDKRINAYLNNLTRLASLAVINLFALSVGFQPGNLILFVISLYSIIMLYNILKIGLGVYELFDPSKLVIGVAEDLVDMINKAKIGRNFSGDPGFQQHYRKVASDCLEKIRTLVRLCEENDQLNETAYRGIMHRCFFIFHYYLSEKRHIPPVSKWYPEVSIERSLLGQNDILRQTFKSTLTNLQTDRSTDFNWFENRVISIFFEHNEKQTAEQAKSKFLISVAAVQTPLTLAGALGMADVANNILGSFKDSLLLITAQKEINESYVLYKNKTLLTEAYYSVVVSFVWHAIEKIESMSVDLLEGEMTKIDWLKRQSLYNTSFYPDSFSELEKMIQRIRFERSVEGQRLTPDWYMQQEVVFHYLKKSTEVLQASIGYIQTYLLDIITVWHKEQKYILCTRLMMSSRELVFKLVFKLRICEQRFDEILKRYKRSKNSNWKLFDFQEGLRQLRNTENVYLPILPDCHLALSVINWDKQSQDLFSMTHLVLSQMINKEMMDNNNENFRQLFSKFPMACVASFTELRTHHQPGLFSDKYASQPILDVLEISGLAFIYSKLHKNPALWDDCCAAWDTTVQNWTAEQYRLIPTLFEAATGYTGGIPLNFNESHERRRLLSDYIEKNKPVINDPILNFYFTKDDPYGDFDWLKVEEIFLELKYYHYPYAKGTEDIVTDRRLYKALTAKE